MFSITEQLSAATKSQLETQLKLLNGYATTAFEGAQKVIALNLSTTRASVEKSSEAAKPSSAPPRPRLSTAPWPMDASCSASPARPRLIFC
jgi:hypothetical protein